jgi:hypothetical protein
MQLISLQLIRSESKTELILALFFGNPIILLSVRMASATHGRLFRQIRSEKSAASNASESWKRRAWLKFPSVCLTMASAERIEELGRQVVSHYLNNLSSRASGSLPSCWVGLYSAQPISSAAQFEYWLWIDYRRRRSPPIDCRASSSISRTFPWAPAPHASRMSPCPRTINKTT